MKKVCVAPIPSADEAVSDLIARAQRRFQRAKRKHDAERWLPITVNEWAPFGVLFFGDPHLDADTCNWDLLLRDVDIARETPGLYAAAIGDYRDNWVGRLMRLYADQSTTAKEGRAMARWFLRDAGIPWLFANTGNHDEWNEGEAILGLLADDALYLGGWRVRVELRAGGQRWRIDSRHDFPGSSIYNKTHGPARAAMFSAGDADLYVCGHRHHYGYQNFEVGEGGGRFAHALRLGAYKWFDKHAERLGYAQSEIPSALVIFDPGAAPAGRVTVFADVEQGARVLTALRGATEPAAVPARRKPPADRKGRQRPGKPPRRP